ncbi:MAG: porin [Pseudomonadota bacterium]
MTGRHLIAILLAGCCCAGAQAQSGITAYGTLAVALRNFTHVDSAGSSRTELGGTSLGSGIWGLRGIERIDADLTLRFRLEGGYFLDTGAQRNNGVLGRETSVGADTPFGKLDLGRLQLVGNAAEPLVRADPLRGAGMTETAWPGIWTGARFDNALRYRLDAGPAYATYMVALDETGGRTTCLVAGYLGGSVTLAAAGQSAHDAAGHASNATDIGVAWTLGATTLHGAVMHATRDKDFLIGATPGAVLFNTDMGLAGVKAPAWQDVMFYLAGVSATLAPGWRLRSAVFLATNRDATLLSAKRGGTQRTAYGLLSYDLSRRTSLLAAMDYNRWSGGWSGFWGASTASLAAQAPDGRDTRRSASLGILHTY